jgi:hypothetical protein
MNSNSDSEDDGIVVGSAFLQSRQSKQQKRIVPSQVVTKSMGGAVSRSPIHTKRSPNSEKKTISTQPLQETPKTSTEFSHTAIGLGEGDVQEQVNQLKALLIGSPSSRTALPEIAILPPRGEAMSRQSPLSVQVIGRQPVSESVPRGDELRSHPEQSAQERTQPGHRKIISEKSSKRRERSWGPVSQDSRQEAPQSRDKQATKHRQQRQVQDKTSRKIVGL